MSETKARLRAALMIGGAVVLAGCNSNAIGLNALAAPITYGALMKIGLVVGAVALVLGAAVYFVSAFGRGMSR